MSRREFVSRFYRNEDDYTKQIENSLKGGDSYLNLPDEINFEHSVPPKERDHKQMETTGSIRSADPVIVDSPGYTKTSYKDQTPKQTGCGLVYALKRLKNKIICKSNPDLEQTFAYDPYKSLVPATAK